MVTHNFWQKYRGGKTSRIKWLFATTLRYHRCFKSFTGLDVYVLYPVDANCKDNSITQNVWLLYSQDIVPNTQNRDWKNRSWIQILDTALFLETTFHGNVYILGMKQLYMLLYLFGIVFFFPNLSVK